ncbi:MAG: 1-(5-phosphoribosyl)-5-((5-phosphoribosylamino)methylideneamino)imidazole-4-carboxamide isomerase, partial [Candidatus Aureabacteria bacterium]|nr:1-(5-phosphoribosyl)-5-((5-phosphoribosylamino)methylideneamino)imidazole-4-carboxamide isomerase [Candidatus Auribacterota bacterium]
MVIIPAIDIADGKCVRLQQGNAEKLTKYFDSPATVAEKWEAEGASFIHIVDLDGAFKGFPVHFDLVVDILSRIKVPVEIGGGIRDLDAIENYLAAGVRRVVLGTSACEDMAFIEKIRKAFSDRVIISVDVKDGFVVKRGW